MKITGAKIPLAGAALALTFLGGVVLAPTFISPAAAQVGSGVAALAERVGVRGDLFKAAAEYIGITPEQLRTEMGADKSMADVAVAHGKTRDGLIAALTAEAAKGIGELVDHKGFPQPPDGRGKRVEFAMKVDLFEAASRYLGITGEQLREQLRSGKSLAQIAAATPGKTEAGLVNAIVADESRRIDQAVAEGKLTAEQGARLKNGLGERVSRMVEHSFDHGRRGGRP